MNEQSDARKLALAVKYMRAATEKLAEFGWVPFGTNVDNDVRLIFSSQVDEAGDPYFERAVLD